LPREAMEAPSLEFFKNNVEVVLKSLFYMSLLEQEVGLGGFYQCNHSVLLLFCDSEELYSMGEISQ